MSLPNTTQFLHAEVRDTAATTSHGTAQICLPQENLHFLLLRAIPRPPLHPPQPLPVCNLLPTSILSPANPHDIVKLIRHTPFLDLVRTRPPGHRAQFWVGTLSVEETKLGHLPRYG